MPLLTNSKTRKPLLTIGQVRKSLNKQLSWCAQMGVTFKRGDDGQVRCTIGVTGLPHCHSETGADAAEALHRSLLAAGLL